MTGVASIPAHERASYSRLWRDFADHLHALLKAKHDGQVLVAKTALELGVDRDTLDRIVYRGLMPSIELADRMLRYFVEGKSFKHSPKIRSLHKKKTSKDFTRVATYISPSTAETYQLMAQRWGLSVPALMNLAIERFAANEPPWVAIKDIIRSIEDAMYADALERNPNLKLLLATDPELVSRVSERPSKPYRDPGLPLPQLELMRLQAAKDGIAVETFPPVDELFEEV